MIQILIHIISYIMALIMSLFPAKPPVETGPTVVDIYGVQYKNCFLEDGIVKTGYGFSAPRDTPFYVEPNGKEWFSVTDSIKLRGDSIASVNQPTNTLYYCPVSEWETLKDYYYDVANWNCTFYGFGYELVEGELVETKYDQAIESVDNERWHQLMDFTHNADRSSNSNYLTVKYDPERFIEANIHFRMVSKDGVFYFDTKNIRAYDGEFYVIDLSVGQEYEIAYQVPEDLKLFILEITGI